MAASAFRSFALGMTGAWLMLVAYRPIVVNVEAPPPPPACPPATTAALVDVAPGVDAGSVPLMLHLDRDEAIGAVDGRAVTSDLEAAVAIADAARHRTWIDVDVETTAGPRRVVVLLH